MWKLHPLTLLRQMFSEQDGTGSYSRLAGYSIVFSTICWCSYSLYKHGGTMPDLGGPAAFITSAAGIHYGLNKASDIIDSFKRNNGSNNDDTPKP